LNNPVYMKTGLPH